MTLSYTLRLVCLLTVVFGLVHVASQIVLSVNARPILWLLSSTTARGRERFLYLVQVAPPLLAIFFAAALCLPEYMRYEPTRESEPVGWPCLILAAAVALWFGLALLRGLRIGLRTHRFNAACRRSGRIAQQISHAIPVLAISEANPPVGFIGFLRPRILISAEMLETGGLHHGALQVALDHERSHAVHLDNWKLLSMGFLPRLPADPWMQHWQSAADWAADDDAVRGDAIRSFLLAEALVCTARAVRKARPSVICTALTSAEAGLAIRVDRLLHPQRSCDYPSFSLHLGLASGLLLLIGGAAVATSPSTLYSLFEHILHLGGV
jgi:hypothetical protein